MEEKTENKDLKTVRKCVRLTKDMDKLFSIIAKEHNTTVGKYLRDAGIILAEAAIDEKEILEFIKDKDKLKVKKKFQHLFEEARNIVINSIAELHGNISTRIDRLEKLMELFLYFYLFHTPEVPEHKKEAAAKSASKRKRKIMAYVEREVQKVREGKDGE